MEQTPRWFQAAMAREPQRTAIDVEDAQIEALTWGEIGKPGIVFLHGGGANAQWWSFIAPFFADSHRVAALSFSGAGNSHWRKHYSIETHLKEALEISDACGVVCNGRKPILIGHSYGCLPIILAAAQHSNDLNAGILVEPTPHLAPHGRFRPVNHVARKRRVYPNVETAIARLKEDPADVDFLLAHIARESLEVILEKDVSGWSWKLDPDFWEKMEMAPSGPHLMAARRPLAMIVGAQSIHTANADARAYFHHFSPPGTPSIEIPGAGHNVMLQQPLALVTAIKTLIATWPHNL